MLDLQANSISVLPDWLKDCKTNFKLDLQGNQISIPIELLTKRDEIGRTEASDLKTLCSFYFQATAEDAAPLSEAKLLIIGEGGAGKTTLAKKLQDSDYKLKLEDSTNPEISTRGIEVNRLPFTQPNGTPFKINLWDFGGQDIYHATHQFFLTRRSLYALVAESRGDTNNDSLYYWLNIVRLLGDNSPVLLIKNEKQKRQCDLDEGSLRKEFPNLINQSLPVDFADNSGLENLRHQIQHHITQLSGVNDSWPHNWAKVRYALENYSKNPNAHYITQEQYITLCHREGVTNRQEALTISSQLHELGICLHFPDPGLRHYVILRPVWVTNAVYKVTDDEQVKTDLGRFSETDLERIWNDNEYSEVKGELLQLMQKFGICYPLRNRPGCYIAPSLLSTDRPNYTWDHSSNLVLRYEYDFMPKGILTRLIVETHELIEPAPEVQGLVWKTGVILRQGNARAEVIENRVKREIKIHVSGAQQVYLLSTIRRELERIHKSFQGNLDVREYVPCNCSHCVKQKAPHMFLLSTLEYRLSKNRYDDECDISLEKVDVRRLIYNIGGADPVSRAEAQRDFHGNQLIVNLPSQTYNEAPQKMSKFTQNNYDNAKGYIAEANEGSTVNQAETINIYNNNQAQILQLVANLRQIATTFPQDLQDDLIIDIDDVEEELKKPEDQRNKAKLKKRLLALAAAVAAIATPIAGITDFANNITDIADKANVELKLPNPPPIAP